MAAVFGNNPLAANISGNALSDLAMQRAGYGGQQLQDQVSDETDEEKKRKKLLQQQTGGITATGSGSSLGGLAVPALFGTYGR